MFQPDESLGYLPASREQVVSLLESINQPQISIPGKAAQTAQAYLCGLRNADGSFAVFASLFLSAAGENVIYAHAPPRLPGGQYAAAESEGRQFLESMGFILDDLNFRGMAPEQQALAMERVPLFSAPRAAPADRVTSPAALARLLASF
ncbi:hypothetical protein [Anaeromyxobacter diazotrophicus]|uniref:Uncharacterized protein n=1 Tax=Anaeromyxobacter diazotrophicus TaxID=2590199 RepID=A0A7I9VNT4_9BACT|nr:hypothetical protein [Anaeromyxobacter diazotrophicus]GEJ58072.1 hypothetical protein AMYX_28130 [Anaeromyxobacter diazotrophicus]